MLFLQAIFYMLKRSMLKRARLRLRWLSSRHTGLNFSPAIRNTQFCTDMFCPADQSSSWAAPSAAVCKCKCKGILDVCGR